MLFQHVEINGLCLSKPRFSHGSHSKCPVIGLGTVNEIHHGIHIDGMPQVQDVANTWVTLRLLGGSRDGKAKVIQAHPGSNPLDWAGPSTFPQRTSLPSKRTRERLVLVGERYLVLSLKLPYKALVDHKW